MAIERVEVQYRSDSANRYKVPERKWRKWCSVARRVFNETYSALAMNQRLFLHPKQDVVSSRMWRTTAWNAAWTAANAVAPR